MNDIVFNEFKEKYKLELVKIDYLNHEFKFLEHLIFSNEKSECRALRDSLKDAIAELITEITKQLTNQLKLDLTRTLRELFPSNIEPELKELAEPLPTRTCGTCKHFHRNAANGDYCGRMGIEPTGESDYCTSYKQREAT
jgi:hypothetical protein